MSEYAKSGRFNYTILLLVGVYLFLMLVLSLVSVVLGVIIVMGVR